MKLFRGAISLMLGGIGLLSSPAWAVPIAVTNFSFEVPVAYSLHSTPLMLMG
jgi:hypothetical protein